MKDVTATQAAVLTGLSERTIRRWIASGRLPARHIAPNRYAIDVRDLPGRSDNADVQDLVARLDTLERRVFLLEAQLVGSPREQGAEDTSASETSGVEMQQLHDLLVQFVHETERIAPLLRGIAGSRRRDELGEARVQQHGA